ncbi:MAG: DUF2937 family protein [Halopseudomonas sp.]
MLKMLDKLVFAAALLLALQIPQLADHYQQFLSGYYQSLRVQVEGYQANAARHQYADVYAMVDDHLRNNTASVRTDAQQKLDTLNDFEATQTAMQLFQQGNLLEKSLYMFAPNRLPALEKTLTNFVPGIPLSGDGILFGVIVGSVINAMLSLPVYLFVRRRKNSHAKKASDAS